MVKIINPFRGRDPVAGAFAGLGKQFAGGQLTPLQAEQLYALQRENTERELLGKALMGFGQEGVDNDALMRELAARGTLAGDNSFDDTVRFLSSNIHGALDPRTDNAFVGAGGAYSSTGGGFTADQTRMREAEEARLQQQAVQEALRLAETVRSNDMSSADRRYGVDQTVGQNMYEYQNMPEPVLDAQGQPTYARRSDLVGGDVSPILSDTQQKGTQAGRHFGDMAALPPEEQAYIGASPGGEAGSVFTYIVPVPGGQPQTFMTRDGVTDLQTGQRLPPGGYRGNITGAATDVGLTNAARTEQEKALVANRKFNALVDLAMPLTENPSLFGAPGFVRSKAQELMQVVNGAQEALTARQDLAAALGENAQALLPELYDPRLPEVETLWGLIVYSGAAALAGQENRSVSDKDIIVMRHILGDPHGLFSSAQGMRTKLEIAQRIVGKFDAIHQDALTQGVTGTLGVQPAAPPPAAPPPAAPPAAPAPTGMPPTFLPEHDPAIRERAWQKLSPEKQQQILRGG